MDTRPGYVQGHIVHNRILAVMRHINWYSFRGQARLAADARVSKSAVSRLLSGKSNPSFSLVWAVTKALERRLGKRLDPCELISIDGSYPTPSVCQLTGCKNCLPEESHDPDNNLKPEFRHIKAGQWDIKEQIASPVRQMTSQEAA